VASPSVAGHTLDEISLPRGSLVVSDHDWTGVARADTEPEAGNRYVVVAESSVVDELLALFRG
jgi:trk system potassium uptake protein TrkA